MDPVGSSSVGSTEDELPQRDLHFTKLRNNMRENIKMETGDSSVREEQTTNNRFKPPLWNHVDVVDKGGQGGGNVKWRCKYCKYVGTSSYSRVKAHLLKIIHVATASQFFISYTIRTFGALTFATIMTTRQLVSILLSCVWFVHPLSWMQWVGAAIVFGTLYTKSFLRSKPQKPAAASPSSHGSSPNSANDS